MTKFDKLTPRQKQVLQAVCETGCNKLAARDLGISDKAIMSHMGVLKAKTGARNRVLMLLEWDRQTRAQQ